MSDMKNVYRGLNLWPDAGPPRCPVMCTGETSNRVTEPELGSECRRFFDPEHLFTAHIWLEIVICPAGQLCMGFQ